MELGKKVWDAPETQLSFDSFLVNEEEETLYKIWASFVIRKELI